MNGYILSFLLFLVKLNNNFSVNLEYQTTKSIMPNHLANGNFLCIFQFSIILFFLLFFKYLLFLNPHLSCFVDVIRCFPHFIFWTIVCLRQSWPFLIPENCFFPAINFSSATFYFPHLYKNCPTLF